MKTPIIVISMLVAACSGESQLFEATNQQLAKNVGDPCAREDERFPDFAGSSVDEVVVEEQDTCGSGVCLTNRFQGRTTCPEGYDPEVDDGRTCTTPDGDPVTAAVLPQLAERPASDAVVCSCRCDGPDGAGPYCACPDGFVCQHGLVESTGLSDLADRSYAGGYCVWAP
jgi:hypothetical protein